MIHPLKEEVYIAIYLIAFGIYLISTYDILLHCIKLSKMPIILKIIIEIIYCIIQLVITYFFSYKLASGYIPVYFIIFLIVGFVVYIYLLRKKLLKTLLYYDENIKPFFLKILKNIMIPFELVQIIIKLIKLVHQKCKSIIEKHKTKKNKTNDINEYS